MKVIDLLNKIANGEEVPEKIEFMEYEYDYDKYHNWYERYDESTKHYILGEDRCLDILLNDEVEIIEEEPRDIEVCGSFFTRSEYNRLAGIKEDKKIEKVDVNHLQQIKKWKRAKILGIKINEIIDYINKEEK